MQIGLGLSSTNRNTNLTLIQQAINVLKSYGSNAHAYIPGIGTINGLIAGNYTLPDGSTGVAAVDGLDGLMLDAMGSVGAELVTNGDFSNGLTGWTPNAGNTADAVVGGELRLTSTSAGACTESQPFTTVIGATYVVQGVARIGTTAIVGLNALATQFGSTLAAVTSSSASNTTLSLYFVATGTTTWVGARLTNALGAGETGFFDNISVKQVTGIHATASGAARPTLRRGAVNLLTWSQDFTNAAWTAQNGAVKVNASTVTVTTVDNSCVLQTIPNSQTNLPNTFAALLSGTGTISLFAFNGTNSFMGQTSVTLTATPTLYTINFTPTVNGSSVFIGWKTGNTATGFVSGGAGLFTGTLTAAQILAQGGIPLTTTAAASNPNAGQYSAEYAGAQALTLGSVPFQMSDDFFVCVGVSCNNKASFPVVYKEAGSTALVASLYFDSAGTVQTQYKTDAAVNTFVVGPVFADSTVGVLSTYKQGGQVSTGLNAVEGTPVAAPTGSFTLTGAQIVNGLNGITGPMIIVNGSVSAADRLTLKRFIASMTPNAPTF